MIMKSWDTFWYALDSRKSLCLLRILIGITLFLKLIGISGIYRFFQGSLGFPQERFANANEYYLEGFNMGYQLISWIPKPNLLNNF